MTAAPPQTQRKPVRTDDATKKRRLALVSGASRGIGYTTALALARAGYDVAAAARDQVRLDDVRSKIAALGVRAFAVQIDVTDRASVDAGVHAVVAAMGPPAIVVNNAGMARSRPFTDISYEEWREILDVNATGAFLMTKACLPAMLEAGWGRVINVASTAALQGYRYTAHYTASKHALLGMTRALALEVATKGVTANCVCPGFVDTEMTQRSIETIAGATGRSLADSRALLEAESPQKRLITPEEVAAAVVYLASDEARGVNGQALVING
jgi:NAD(P)-dependent dehydrogenase (short-subunit alcohol dehydrogenase family)